MSFHFLHTLTLKTMRFQQVAKPFYFSHLDSFESISHYLSKFGEKFVKGVGPILWSCFCFCKTLTVSSDGPS